MLIVRAHEFGAPEKLVVEQVAAPEPGPGQVRIAVRAAAVNPVDWKLLSGKAPVLPPLPLVPGGDLSGTIDAVGEGVTGLAIGDRVFCHPGLTGAYAGQVAVAADAVAAIPAGLDFIHAAALPLAGLTAQQALAADGRDLAVLHVLVHGGAGGVGILAIQLARAAGARVTATASAANAAFVQDLGAQDVADFRTQPVAGRARDVDVLVDLVGNSQETGLWALVRDGGSVVRIAGGAQAQPFEQADGIRAYKWRVRPDGAGLARLAALADSGQLRPVIEQVFPIACVAEALRLSMAGHARGKIVLTLD